MKLKFGNSTKHLTPFPLQLKTLKKFLETNFSTLKNIQTEPKSSLQIYYIDSENDKITVSEDDDLKEANRYQTMKGIEIDVNVEQTNIPKPVEIAKEEIPQSKKEEVKQVILNQEELMRQKIREVVRESIMG